MGGTFWLGSSFTYQCVRKPYNDCRVKVCVGGGRKAAGRVHFQLNTEARSCKLGACANLLQKSISNTWTPPHGAP